MHLLDNYISKKFLEDIKVLFSQYNITDSTNVLGALYREEVYNNNFRTDLFNLYKKHYHRNLIIAEILATKQDLDIERQVISLVRNHITIKNIKLRTIHIICLYLSYLDQRIINIPETITHSFFQIRRPE